MGAQSIRIGIVTPSYNQGHFLQETIESVLSQGYPNLEYVIIDGGSTDDSVEIIRKYERHLSFWLSERDSGQSEAINKGLRRLINTDIWAYLNSDDVYRPGTFSKVAAAFQDPTVDWVTGEAAYVDEKGLALKRLLPTDQWKTEDVLEKLIREPVVVAVQVSNFMRNSILKKFGYFDETLHYCMDVEYGLRLILSGIRPQIINSPLAHARLHSASKTMNQAETNAFARETAKILESILDDRSCSDSEANSIKRALWNHRRQTSLENVRRSWQEGNSASGVLSWLATVASQPSLLAYRPALGLLRQILMHRRTI